MAVMKNEIANDWSGNQPRRSEDVGDSVDVLFGRDLPQSVKYWLVLG